MGFTPLSSLRAGESSFKEVAVGKEKTQRKRENEKEKYVNRSVVYEFLFYISETTKKVHIVAQSTSTGKIRSTERPAASSFGRDGSVLRRGRLCALLDGKSVHVGERRRPDLISRRSSTKQVHASRILLFVITESR